MKKAQIINAGDYVYIKSRHTQLELLCKVEMAEYFALKVKLPCTINGHTHEVVQTKDARLKKPTQDRAEPAVSPMKSPASNPFRKLLSALTAETEEEEKARLQKEEQKKRRAPAPVVSSSYTGLSADEMDFIEGLSASDKKAYMELWK